MTKRTVSMYVIKILNGQNICIGIINFNYFGHKQSVQTFKKWRISLLSGFFNWIADKL